MNILKASVYQSKKTILLSFETIEELKAVTSFNFQEKGLNLEMKILTNNNELDSRKVRLTRLSTHRLNNNHIQQVVSRYGNIEELYEIKGNPRKRSLIVAFETNKDKSNFLRKDTIFIGSELF